MRLCNIEQNGTRLGLGLGHYGNSGLLFLPELGFAADAGAWVPTGERLRLPTLPLAVANVSLALTPATALLVEAFRWAEEFGVARIALSVYPDNAPAVGLYRKFGFVEEGRLVRHLLKPVGYVDEVLMARWLQ